MDWAVFRQAVEDTINTAREFDSLSEQVAVFNDILIEAGNKYVRKTKIARTKFAMNPKVKTLAKKRNRLCKEVASKRKEWLERLE